MCNAWNHDPGCTCGWGGDGHLGISLGGFGGLFRTGSFKPSFSDDDFCQPTTCKHCGKPIFFVRHNGGSVSFDSLGPPWPEHPCFSDDAFGIQLRKELKAKQKSTPESWPPTLFGVITETETTPLGRSGRMVVRCNDGTILDQQVSSELDLSRLPGRLVVVVRGEKGELSFEIVSQAVPKLAKFFQIIEISTERVIAEYPFPRKTEAAQHLQTLESEQAGKHRIREANLMAYL